MVNFEDGNTVARNKKELQELTTLQRRYQTINAIQAYKARFYKDSVEDNLKLAEIQANLMALYYEVDSAIYKDIQKNNKGASYTSIEQLTKDIESQEPKDVFKAWEYINQLLYRLHLTKLDSTKDINWEDPETVNEEHGLG